MWVCEDQPHQLFLMRSGSIFETNQFQLQSSNGLCLNPSPGDRGVSFSQWTCGADFASAPHQFFSVEQRGVVAPAAASAPPPPPPVPRCLLDQETCNPDDVQCCDGEYCETIYTRFSGLTSTCRTCIAAGDGCGTSMYAQQCCQYLSCRYAPGAKWPSCIQGDCEREIGKECGDKPCCGGLECSTWLGASVCRPIQPTCAKGGGVPCTDCCSHRCSSSSSDVTSGDAIYAETTGIAFVSGGCACASSENQCVDDSYCCSGKCGINYKCID